MSRRRPAPRRTQTKPRPAWLWRGFCLSACRVENPAFSHARMRSAPTSVIRFSDRREGGWFRLSGGPASAPWAPHRAGPGLYARWFHARAPSCLVGSAARAVCVCPPRSPEEPAVSHGGPGASRPRADTGHTIDLGPRGRRVKRYKARRSAPSRRARADQLVAALHQVGDGDEHAQRQGAEPDKQPCPALSLRVEMLRRF
jgi:hypothetical protein